MAKGLSGGKDDKLKSILQEQQADFMKNIEEMINDGVEKIRQGKNKTVKENNKATKETVSNINQNAKRVEKAYKEAFGRLSKLDFSYNLGDSKVDFSSFGESIKKQTNQIKKEARALKTKVESYLKDIYEQEELVDGIDVFKLEEEIKNLYRGGFDIKEVKKNANAIAKSFNIQNKDIKDKLIEREKIISAYNKINKNLTFDIGNEEDNKKMLSDAVSAYRMGAYLEKIDLELSIGGIELDKMIDFDDKILKDKIKNFVKTISSQDVLSNMFVSQADKIIQVYDEIFHAIDDKIQKINISINTEGVKEAKKEVEDIGTIIQNVSKEIEDTDINYGNLRAKIERLNSSKKSQLKGDASKVRYALEIADLQHQGIDIQGLTEESRAMEILNQLLQENIELKKQYDLVKENGIGGSYVPNPDNIANPVVVDQEEINKLRQRSENVQKEDELVQELTKSYLELFEIQKRMNEIRKKYPDDDSIMVSFGDELIDESDFDKNGTISSMLKLYFSNDEVEEILERAKENIIEFKKSFDLFETAYKMEDYDEKFNKSSLKDKIAFIENIAKGGKKSDENFKTFKDMTSVGDVVVELLDGTTEYLSESSLPIGDTFHNYENNIKGKIKNIKYVFTESVEDLRYTAESRMEDIGNAIGDKLDVVQSIINDRLFNLFKTDVGFKVYEQVEENYNDDLLFYDVKGMDFNDITNQAEEIWMQTEEFKECYEKYNLLINDIHNFEKNNINYREYPPVLINSDNIEESIAMINQYINRLRELQDNMFFQYIPRNKDDIESISNLIDISKQMQNSSDNKQSSTKPATNLSIEEQISQLVSGVNGIKDGYTMQNSPIAESIEKWLVDAIDRIKEGKSDLHTEMSDFGEFVKKENEELQKNILANKYKDWVSDSFGNMKKAQPKNFDKIAQNIKEGIITNLDEAMAKTQATSEGLQYKLGKVSSMLTDIHLTYSKLENTDANSKESTWLSNEISAADHYLKLLDELEQANGTILIPEKYGELNAKKNNNSEVIKEIREQIIAKKNEFSDILSKIDLEQEKIDHEFKYSRSRFIEEASKVDGFDKERDQDIIQYWSHQLQKETMTVEEILEYFQSSLTARINKINNELSKVKFDEFLSELDPDDFTDVDKLLDLGNKLSYKVGSGVVNLEDAKRQIEELKKLNDQPIEEFSQQQNLQDISDKLNQIELQAKDAKDRIQEIQSYGSSGVTKDENFYTGQIEKMTNLLSSLDILEQENKSLQYPDTATALSSQQDKNNNFIKNIRMVLLQQKDELVAEYESIDFEAQRQQQKINATIAEFSKEVVKIEGFNKYGKQEWISEYVAQLQNGGITIEDAYDEIKEKIRISSEEAKKELEEQQKRLLIGENYKKFGEYTGTILNNWKSKNSPLASAISNWINEGFAEINNGADYEKVLEDFDSKLQAEQNKIIEHVDNFNKVLTEKFGKDTTKYPNGISNLLGDLANGIIEFEDAVKQVNELENIETSHVLSDNITSIESKSKTKQDEQSVQEEINSLEKLLELKYKVKNVNKSYYSGKYNTEWFGYYHSQEEAIADDINRNKMNLNSSLNLILSEDKNAINELEEEANKLKSSLQSVTDLTNRISTNSSISYLDQEERGTEDWYKGYAKEYKEIDERLGELYNQYELTNEELEEYITLQVKAQKIMDQMIDRSGGVKGSGAKNRHELELWIKQSFARDLDIDPKEIYNGLFGNITDAFYEGHLSLFDDKGKQRTLREISAEILDYQSITSKIGGAIGANDDDKRLREINSILKYIKNNIHEIESTDFSTKIQELYEAVDIYSKRLEENPDDNGLIHILTESKKELQELIILQERLNNARSSETVNTNGQEIIPDKKKRKLKIANSKYLNQQQQESLVEDNIDEELRNKINKIKTGKEILSQVREDNDFGDYGEEGSLSDESYDEIINDIKTMNLSYEDVLSTLTKIRDLEKESHILYGQMSGLNVFSEEYEKLDNSHTEKYKQARDLEDSLSILDLFIDKTNKSINRDTSDQELRTYAKDYMEYIAQAKLELNAIDDISFANLMQSLSKVQTPVEQIEQKAELASKELIKIGDVYRAVRGQNIEFLDHNPDGTGAIWATSEKDLYNTLYTGGNEGKEYSAEFYARNPLVIDAKGQSFNSITYLGDGVDEVSKRITELYNEIQRLEKARKESFDATGSETEEYIELCKQLGVAKTLYDDISKSKNNVYGTHWTDDFVALAKANGYDALKIENVYDDTNNLATTYAVWSEDQIKNIQLIASGKEELFKIHNELTQQETQSSNEATDTIIENENKKQQAYDETSKKVKEIGQVFGITNKNALNEIQEVLDEYNKSNQTNFHTDENGYLILDDSFEDETDIFANAGTSINEVLDVISKHIKSSKEEIDAYTKSWKEVRKYVSDSKIYIDSKVKSELGDEYDSMHGTIGINTLTTDDKSGTDIIVFLREMNECLGTTFDLTQSNQGAFEELYNYLKNKPLKINPDTLPESIKDTVNQILDGTYFQANDQDIDSNEEVIASKNHKRKLRIANKDYISNINNKEHVSDPQDPPDPPKRKLKIANRDYLAKIKANQQESQSSNDTTDTIIENEEKKQQASDETTDIIVTNNKKQSDSEKEKAETTEEFTERSNNTRKNEIEFMYNVYEGEDIPDPRRIGIESNNNPDGGNTDVDNYLNRIDLSNARLIRQRGLIGVDDRVVATFQTAFGQIVTAVFDEAGEVIEESLVYTTNFQDLTKQVKNTMSLIAKDIRTLESNQLKYGSHYDGSAINSRIESNKDLVQLLFEQSRIYADDDRYIVEYEQFLRDYTEIQNAIDQDTEIRRASVEAQISADREKDDAKLVATKSKYEEKLSAVNDFFKNTDQYANVEKAIQDLNGVDTASLDKVNAEFNALNETINDFKQNVKSSASLDPVFSAIKKKNNIEYIVEQYKQSFEKIGYSSEDAENKIKDLFKIGAKIQGIDINDSNGISNLGEQIKLFNLEEDKLNSILKIEKNRKQIQDKRNKEANKAAKEELDVVKESYKLEKQLEDRKYRLQSSNIGANSKTKAKNDVRIAELDRQIGEVQQDRMDRGLYNEEERNKLLQHRESLIHNLQVEQEAYNASVKQADKEAHDQWKNKAYELKNNLQQALQNYSSADQQTKDKAGTLLEQLKRPTFGSYDGIDFAHIDDSNVKQVVKKIEADTKQIIDSLKKQHDKIEKQQQQSVYSGITKDYENQLDEKLYGTDFEGAMFKSSKVDSSGKTVLTFLEVLGNKVRETKVYIDDANQALDDLNRNDGSFDIYSFKSDSKYRNIQMSDIDGINEEDQIKAKIQAYKELSKTEKQYQTLRASVDNGTATDKQKAEYEFLCKIRQRYNDIIQRTIELLTAEDQLYYDQVGKPLIDREENKYKAVQQIEQGRYDVFANMYHVEDVNSAQDEAIKINDAINRTSKLMEGLNKKNINGFDKIFDNASNEVDELNKSLQQGDIELDKYFKEIQNITSRLKNTINIVDVDSQGKAKKEMLKYAKTLPGVEIGKFNNETNSLSVSFEKQKGIIQEIILQYDNMTGAITRVDKNTENVKGTLTSFIKGLKKRFMSLGQYLLSFAGFYEIVGWIKNGITVVRDLDVALTEMRKVSDENVESLKNFQKVSFNIASGIGATAKQIQESTADFMRLGYDLNTASNLAKDANIYANVGDMDIGESTEHMISSIKAWESEFDNEIEASGAIVDRYNEIGNNFAITSADIGSAMERAAAALKAGGNTLNESLGLITAGNLIQQDADTTANALKVLSLRIRGSKTELEEMGEETDGLADSSSKLREEIKALTGVDIMENEDTYKSTAEILTEIGAVYDKLSDVSQASLLEKLAGKTRASTVAGLLENYETINEVIETAENADGSAIEENLRYMESIEGKISQFQNEVQEFWYGLISSETVKKFVSLATTIVDKIGNITSALGEAGTVAAVFGSALGFKALKNGGKAKMLVFIKIKNAA